MAAHRSGYCRRCSWLARTSKADDVGAACGLDLQALALWQLLVTHLCVPDLQGVLACRQVERGDPVHARDGEVRGVDDVDEGGHAVADVATQDGPAGLHHQEGRHEGAVALPHFGLGARWGGGPSASKLDGDHGVGQRRAVGVDHAEVHGGVEGRATSHARSEEAEEAKAWAERVLQHARPFQRSSVTMSRRLGASLLSSSFLAAWLTPVRSSSSLRIWTTVSNSEPPRPRSAWALRMVSPSYTQGPSATLQRWAARLAESVRRLMPSNVRLVRGSVDMR